MPSPAPDLEPVVQVHRRFLRSSTTADHNRALRDELVAAAIASGASYGQVAKALGIPRGTVQSIVRKRREFNLRLTSARGT